MKSKLLATTLIPFFFATAAMSQTDTAGSTAGQSMTGHSWSDAAAETFFSDDGTMTLRSEEDSRASWATLPEEDRASVRADCAALESDAASKGTDTTTGGAATTGTDTTMTGSADTATTGSATTGTGTVATGTDTAATGTADTAATGTADTAATGTSLGAAGTGAIRQSITQGQVTQASWDELCTIVDDL